MITWVAGSGGVTNAEKTKTPKVIAIANMITGIPVPTPNSIGKNIPKLLFKARGIRLPKKSPAETGQNDNAKTIPSRKAPFNPDPANFV